MLPYRIHKISPVSEDFEYDEWYLALCVVTEDGEVDFVPARLEVQTDMGWMPVGIEE